MLLLALVAAPAAHAMPRLGDVGELEVEAERAQDSRRALLVERAHAGRERRAVGRRARVPGLAREVPHALDVGQQILADLLDEHAPERVADEAHVAPQRVVAAARRRAAGSSAAVLDMARSLWASASATRTPARTSTAARAGVRTTMSIGNEPRRELTLRFGLQEIQHVQERGDADAQG